MSNSHLRFSFFLFFFFLFAGGLSAWLRKPELLATASWENYLLGIAVSALGSGTYYVVFHPKNEEY